ncbi:hypothetical protein G7046_g7299 [Stylonectria norvegica]|nr:hypothetical protein G7046_g7299 [Stylonectria norvegica]
MVRVTVASTNTSPPVVSSRASESAPNGSPRAWTIPNCPLSSVGSDLALEVAPRLKWPRAASAQDGICWIVSTYFQHVVHVWLNNIELEVEKDAA